MNRLYFHGYKYRTRNAEIFHCLYIEAVFRDVEEKVFSECAWKEQPTVYCSTVPAKLFFDEYMHIFLGFGMWKTLVGYLFGYDRVLKYNRYQVQRFLNWKSPPLMVTLQTTEMWAKGFSDVQQSSAFPLTVSRQGGFLWLQKDAGCISKGNSHFV